MMKNSAAACRGLVSLALLSLTAFSQIALAQAFPSKPIRLIVTAAAGASTDIIARKLGQVIQAQSGATVVVENIGGASGSIGLQTVARAAPDGYTLAVALPDSVTLFPMSRSPAPYELGKNLVPVAMMGETNYVLVVNAQNKANTLREFIQNAKASDKPMTFSSGGNATSGRITVEMFKQEAGIEMMHVPYRGAAPALLAVASGEVDMIATSAASMKALAASGKVKPLAITRADRSPLTPEIPSATEAGVPGLIIPVWWGIFGPPKMSKEVYEKLSQIFAAAVASPDFQAQVTALGAEAKPRIGSEFSDFVSKDRLMWEGIVRKGRLNLGE